MQKAKIRAGPGLKPEAYQSCGQTADCLPRSILRKGRKMNDHQRKVYVGIDVHRKEHKAAIIPLSVLESSGAGWKEVKPLNLKNNIHDFELLDTAIRGYAACAEEAAIAVDHTGGHYSEPLVYFLQSRGYDVCHLETKAVKAARERFLDQENKSDVIDSTSAAYLLYLRDTHGVSFRISAVIPELGSKAAALHSLVLQRWQFHKQVTQATNRLHQLLLAVFPEGEARYFNKLLEIIQWYPTPEDILASGDLNTIEKLSHKEREDILRLAAQSVGVPGGLYRQLIKDISVQRMEAVAKRDALTLTMRREVAAHPYGEVLLSFPCLGEIAAATIIGVVKDIDRWPDKKKFKKALGVYSNTSQSGSGAGRTRQGKEGSRDGRRVLFQVCFGCIRSNVSDNDSRDYYLRQVARGKPRLKALVSTMGKLAEIIYHCLKTREHYQYQGKYRNRST